MVLRIRTGIGGSRSRERICVLSFVIEGEGELSSFGRLLPFLHLLLLIPKQILHIK